MVWVDHSIGVVHDRHGAPVSYISQFVDVTEARSRLEHAEAERTRLQATLDSLLDPHVLLVAVRDDGGRIVDFVYADANDVALSYMGMTRSELIGARLLDVLPGQAGSGMLALYAGAVEDGLPLHLDDYAYPHELLGSERRYDIRGVRVGDALSFTWRDVTDRYATAHALAESEARFRLLAENSSDVVMHLRDGVVVWVSPSLRHAVGWEPSSWVGQKTQNFVHPEDHPVLVRHRETVTAGQPTVFRVRVRSKYGGFRWIENHGSPYYDAQGRQDGTVASWRVVDEQVETERALDRRARYDDLTGLPNRQEALEQLTTRLSRVSAPGPALVVAFCDVDNFKEINDRFGHAAGDEVLCEIGSRLQAVLRPDDLVARLGGDEFLVVLNRVADVATAAAVADKIRVAVSQPIQTGEGPTNTSLSIGLTCARPNEPVPALLARADLAMYEAKRSGRNRVMAID